MINQSKMSFYASANTNRERHQKYNHPKGAPDVDLIFGSGGSVNVGFNSTKQRHNNSPNATSDILSRSSSEMNKNFPNISANSTGTTGSGGASSSAMKQMPQ